MEPPGRYRPERTTYFVDEREQTTRQEELTVRRILEKAEFPDVDDRLLIELRGGERVLHLDPDERIPIRPEARFETRTERSLESAPGPAEPIVSEGPPAGPTRPRPVPGLAG